MPPSRVSSLVENVLPEATFHLQELVRIDTSNPPGNERPAAEYLARVLAREDIEAHLLGPTPERQSLVARVPGDGSRRPLLFVSHLDVVPATQPDWSVPPFGGVLKDRFVWGRGAMDCKYRAVTHAMLLLLTSRERLPLRRDLVMAACADEETGGELGMKWLSVQHPEWVQAEFVLGEGGGGEIPAPRGRYCAVGAGERGAYAVEATLHGTGGHSYKPHSDNVLLKLGRALRGLEERRLGSLLTPSAAGAIRGLAEDQDEPLRGALLALLEPDTRDQALSQVQGLSPDLARWLEPTLYSSLTPTMVSGGDNLHSVPTEARLYCNARLLPGHSETFLARVLMERWSGLTGLEWKLVPEASPSESSLETDLFQALVELYREECPGVRVVPWMLGGATDVRFLRTPGRTVYGFFPSKMDLPFTVWNRITHGVDERISLANLQWAIHMLYHLILKLGL